MAFQRFMNGASSREAGGLASYGTSIAAMYDYLGVYVDRVLSGAKPADLVYQPTKFEFLVNSKTANALGLILPESVRARIDEFIE